MKKINSKQFNFQFFLSGSKKVSSLKDGATLHGGATKFDDGIYSNIEGSDMIEIKENDNEISIFIPSTVDIFTKTNSQRHIEKAINHLEMYYSITDNLKYYKTMGSWYSEDNKKVVIEDITIITLKLDQLHETDINIFINLAKIIKRDMNQEGVTVAINTAMAII